MSVTRVVHFSFPFLVHYCIPVDNTHWTLWKSPFDFVFDNKNFNLSFWSSFNNVGGRISPSINFLWRYYILVYVWMQLSMSSATRLMLISRQSCPIRSSNRWVNRADLASIERISRFCWRHSIWCQNGGLGTPNLRRYYYAEVIHKPAPPFLA